MNFNQLINELRKLNPTAEIRVGNPTVDYLAETRIFSSIPNDILKLPDNYYNLHEGITNKDNKDVTSYLSLKVEPLTNMILEEVYPNVKVNKPLITTDIKEIAIALQRINVGVAIKLGNPKLDSASQNQIYSSVPISELALPVPFYQDENNKITNKKEGGNGFHLELDVVSLKEVDPKILIPTGYDLVGEMNKQYCLDLKRKIETEGIVNNNNDSYKYGSPLLGVDASIWQKDTTKEVLDPTLEMLKMQQEQQRFTILQRGRAFDENKKAQVCSVLIAALCFFGSGLIVNYTGMETNSILAKELEVFTSWTAFVQKFKNIGPLPTLLTATSCVYLLKSFSHYLKANKIKTENFDYEFALAQPFRYKNKEKVKVK